MASLMRRRRASLGHRLDNARGSELVEFALILPLLLILIAGIVDFALMFQAYEVVTNAAREGARVSVLPPPYSPNVDPQLRVREYVAAAGLTGALVTAVVPVATAGGGRGFQVSVAYTHPLTLLGPFLSLIGGTAASTITLNGVSVMRAETVVGP